MIFSKDIRSSHSSFYSHQKTMQPKSKFFYRMSDFFFRVSRDFSEVLVLLPNYHASIPLYESLQQAKGDGAIWLPKVSSIKNLAVEISGCRSAATPELVYALYTAYKEVFGKKNSYAILDFYTLGTDLLHAFDIIAMSGMDLESISSAWRGATELEFEDFIKLHNVYKKNLLSAHMGYKGLLFSEALSVLDRDFFLAKTYTRIIVAGFAGFSPIEKKFLKKLASLVSLECYSDIGEQMIELNGRDAKNFLYVYKTDPVYHLSLHGLVPEKSCCKSIEIVNTQTRTAQLEILYTRLSDVTRRADSESIAVIMQDADLLLPLINSIPVEANRLNIHLNVELRYTHTYAILVALLDFYYMQAPLIGEGILEISFLEKILSNPIFAPNLGVKNFLKLFSKTQNRYMNVSPLKNFITIIDKILNTGVHESFVEYLFSFYEELRSLVKNLKFSALEAEALNVVEKNFFEIKDFIKNYEHTESVIAFIKEQLRSCAIPITQKGESNIHLISLEQTACLSYDTVFILDATEGNLSGGLRRDNFFRRDNRELSLYASTLENEKAYLIHRLLHSAEKIVALYSSQAGELSQYLLQLSYLLPQITTKTVESPHIISPKSHSLVIEKKAEVLETLDKFNALKSQNPLEFSASSINTYLDCSLKFYFTYLENIRPLERKEKLAKHEIFGTLLHEILASIYRPFADSEGKLLVQERDIKKIIENLDSTIAHHFKETFERDLPSSFHHKSGYNLVAEEMMRKYVRAMLDADFGYAPFSILSVEKIIQAAHTVSPHLAIGIKSKLDRVDAKASTMRVVDYKTGTVNNKLSSISSCFDKNAKNRNAIAFQLLLYAWVFQMDEKAKSERITPCVVGTKNIFTNKNDFNIYLKIGKKYTTIEDIQSVLGEFIEHLNGTILELFDAAVPFTQTENRAICAKCDFKNICQRF